MKIDKDPNPVCKTSALSGYKYTVAQMNNI